MMIPEILRKLFIEMSLETKGKHSLPFVARLINRNPTTLLSSTLNVSENADKGESMLNTSVKQSNNCPTSRQDVQLQEILVRFRRPTLTDDYSAGITDSYETLTLSEFQQLDVSLDVDGQAQLEELQLALGDFDEFDEFEEVDEFEDDWEEDIGVSGEWDVEDDAYCHSNEYDDDFLDAAN